MIPDGNVASIPNATHRLENLPPKEESIHGSIGAVGVCVSLAWLTELPSERIVSALCPNEDKQSVLRIRVRHAVRKKRRA